MLILTRRAGERVVIGEDVLVTVMEVSGQTVRLGIAAPQGLPIYREEIWLAVKEENRAAAEAAADALPAQGASDTPPPSQSEGTRGREGDRG
jgi:carbon storage regulator